MTVKKPSFGFGLDESSALARKLYEANGVNCSHWNAVDASWRHSKGKLGRILDPGTWRASRAIQVQAKGYSAKTLFTNSLSDASCHFMGPEKKPLPFGLVYHADVEKGIVDELSPLIGQAALPGKKSPIRAGMKLSRAWALILERYCGFPANGKGGASDIVGKAFDAYRVSSGGTMVLSANILDILTASHSCSWSSCHRLGGCHKAGPLQYLFDDMTLIAYIYREEREDIGDDEEVYGCKQKLPLKTWRQMVFAKNGSATFMMQYGKELPDSTHKEVRKLVAETLARLAGVEVPPEPLWNLRRDTESFYPINQEEESVAYLDPTHCSIRIGYSYLSRESLAEEMTCPSCGKKRLSSTWDSEHLTCPKCGGCKRCVSCGEPVEDASDGYPHGDGVLCGPCYEESYFSCNRCGCTTHQDDSFNHGYDSYCENCHYTHFRECHNCSEIFPRNDTYQVRGRCFCEECHSEHCANCCYCGTDFVVDHMTKTVDGLSCSRCCLYHETCPRCEEMYSGVIPCAHCPNCAPQEANNEQIA